MSCPSDLAQYDFLRLAALLPGFTFPVKMKDPKNIMVDDGVCEVSNAPTGCMLIKRTVFEKLIKAYPNKRIKQTNQSIFLYIEIFYKIFTIYNFKKTYY